MSERENFIKRYHLRTMMSEELLEALTLRHYHTGAYILHAGDELKGLCMIVKGKAKTLYQTRNGVQTLHSFLHPLSFIGDVELMQNIPIINDVIALDEVDVLHLSLRYQDVMFRDIKFLTTLSQELSSKLVRSNHNKSISLTYPVEHRLAAYLCANVAQDVFQGNQQDAAEMIGCSYRQLQRTLQQFIKEGILYKEKKGVYRIIDRNYLLRLGNDVYVL